MSAIKPLVAGNWKMNGLRAALAELTAVCEGYSDELRTAVDLAVCPPATMTYLAAATVLNADIAVGGQDCHWKQSGAHTGDISAEMLKDAGASVVIVGHSERRADHGETNEIVAWKAAAAHAAGLVAIVCVGETEAEREEGRTLEVVASQLTGSLPAAATARDTVIAYEPVWAIGTGRTPTAADVAEVHAMIREHVSRTHRADGGAMRLLYGGSVKPANARELMAVENVDGALVGGASLKASDFLGIAAAYI